jgi:hypothetical protein
MCFLPILDSRAFFFQTTHQNVTTVMDIVVTAFPSRAAGVDSFLGVLPFYHIYGMQPKLSCTSIAAHLALITQVPLNWCTSHSPVVSQWLFKLDLTPFNFVPTLKGIKSPAL